jgi:hypothetical protein
LVDDAFGSMTRTHAASNSNGHSSELFYDNKTSCKTQLVAILY